MHIHLGPIVLLIWAHPAWKETDLGGRITGIAIIPWTLFVVLWVGVGLTDDE